MGWLIGGGLIVLGVGGLVWAWLRSLKPGDLP